MANHAGASLLESSPLSNGTFGAAAGALLAPRDDVGGNFGNLWAALRTMDGEAVAQGSADPSCDQEISLTVPLSAPVSVGQRFELSLEHRDPAIGTAEPMVDGQYATVFRTEVVSRPNGKALCIGLRLDQPMML